MSFVDKIRDIFNVPLKAIDHIDTYTAQQAGKQVKQTAPDIDASKEPQLQFHSGVSAWA